MGRQAAEPADLETIGGRLRWAREQYVTPDGGRLSSSRAAARFFGWPENTYKSHEQGERQVKALKYDHAEKYARAYNITVEWLVLGRGHPFSKPLPTVRVAPGRDTSKKATSS